MKISYNGIASIRALRTNLFQLYYRLSNICSLATLTEQSSEIVGLLQENPGRLSVGTEAGVNIFLIALTTFSHCLGVKVRRT
jgi:hypothetical protein